MRILFTKRLHFSALKIGLLKLEGTIFPVAMSECLDATQ